MWNEIATWQETLTLRPDLSVKTISHYTQDTRRFATWLQSEHPGLKATEVTPTDAKAYRNHLEPSKNRQEKNVRWARDYEYKWAQLGSNQRPTR